MYNIKREEIENAKILDSVPVYQLQNLYAFYKVSYEVNDGKISSMNIPKNLNTLID